MSRKSISPRDALRRHIYATYFTLRWGIAILSFVFPWVMVLGGLCIKVPLQDSLSAYYHASSGTACTLRDGFVGFLFALGALMYLYKGFTRAENWLLNISSILTIGVALFPIEWPKNPETAEFSLHGFCAIGAFVCLALVSWLSPRRSLKLMSSGSKRKRYTKAYVAFGIFMLVFPGLAWLLTIAAGDPGKFVFAVEALGLVGFSGYWATKSFEMHDTKGELKVLGGEVTSETLCDCC